MARLEFAGARYVRNYHLAVPHHELDIDKKKSLSASPSLDDNLIIHGDNLKALKALLPHYAGKVKCIYIDPPYNTGNENWVYNDNVNSPRHKEWLGKVVDKDCQDRHDRWLSMMTPRLKLLLRDDGVIFISIDDNEVHHLRMLMDEIFGEDNFLANIIWQHSVQGKGYTTKYSVHHNHILVYQKTTDYDLIVLDRTEEDNRSYSNPDNDPRGDWRTGDIRNALYRPNLIYDVKTPSGKIIKPPSNGWRFSKATMQLKIEDKRVVFSEDEKRIIYKIYLSEVDGRVPETIWFSKDVGSTRDGKNTLKELFDGTAPFDTPKPVELLEKIINISCESNDIILDSFAGSGTTAHAVLALNKEDGGNRKFILVEQEEYADTITAERVRRVIKGVKGAKDENLKAGLGGSFSYLTFGDEYDVAKILSGKSLPKYEDMASYVFQTATGETLDRKKMEKKKQFIGSSKFYDVYLFYEPDVEKLKSSDCALKLDFVEAFKGKGKKKRLVFGAVRYVNQETMNNYDVEFCQLPYEVYRRIEDAA